MTVGELVGTRRLAPPGVDAVWVDENGEPFSAVGTTAWCPVQRQIVPLVLHTFPDDGTTETWCAWCGANVHRLA